LTIIDARSTQPREKHALMVFREQPSPGRPGSANCRGALRGALGVRQNQQTEGTMIDQQQDHRERGEQVRKQTPPLDYDVAPEADIKQGLDRASGAERDEASQPGEPGSRPRRSLAEWEWGHALKDYFNGVDSPAQRAAIDRVTRLDASMLLRVK